MTQYVINIGAIPNDGTGDPLRTAFNETNLNFDQVFAAGPVLSNIQIANNTIMTTNVNGNLVLAPNGTAVVQSNVSIVPNTANIRNLGSSTRRWATVYAQYLNATQINLTGDLTVSGNLTVQGNIIQVGNIVTETLTIQLANAASTANAANGAGITVGANDNIATMLYSSTSNTWTTNIGLSSVGNITAPYFIGNGSQLTGITSYANANAVAYGESGWAGNIVPSGNAVYSLGNATNQWNDLYVSNATIFMNNVPISLSAGNVLTVNGNAVLTNGSNTAVSTTGNITAGNVLTGGVVSATGNVTGGNLTTTGTANVASLAVTGSATVQGSIGIYSTSTSLSATGNVIVGNILTGGLISATGNITGNYFVGNGSQLTGISAGANTGNVTFNDVNIIGDGNLRLQPDPANASAYLDIYLTAGPDIHIAGNGETVILGTDDFANVTVNVDGNVSIQASNGTPHTWTFDTAGNLNLPGNIIAINYLNGNRAFGTVTFNNEAVIGTGTSNTQSGLYLAPDPGSLANNLYLRVRGNILDEATHIHFDTGNNQYFSQFIGDDNKYIQLANTGNIVINTNNYAGNTAQWTFDTDGSLTLPGANADYTIATSGGYITVGNLLIGQGGSLFNSNNDSWALYGNISDPGTSISIPSDAAAGNGTPLVLENQISNVEIRSGFGTWTFGNTGVLTLPNADASGFGNIYFEQNSSTITFGLDDNATPYLYSFATSGITLPRGGATIRDTVGNAVAFGRDAAATGPQGNAAVAIGQQAGETSQGDSAMAIGYQAGFNTQNANAVAIGREAGQTTQQAGAVAVGLNAGTYIQGQNAVAIGSRAGNTSQQTQSVAIGVDAAADSQGQNSVAIGPSAAAGNQGQKAVAIGLYAGNTSQGESAVSIGDNAGFANQGEIAVAIGYYAGNTAQGNAAVAVGAGAGTSTQGVHAVAIGTDSGATTQGNRAVAIGYLAGGTAQGTAAVAIGYYAGELNQGNNSIIINATDTSLQQTTANTFTVAPVRNDVANIAEVMFYNTTSKEITYGNVISVAGNVTAANFFGNGNTLSNVATTFESTWTVPTGNSTQSFTVTPNNTYYLWVDCNIANGILAWNATATVTNTNVPVVGAQYAWVYSGGGTPIDFTSIPDQFVGTSNTIVRSSVSPSATTNRFDFGINNASGNAVTVNYGYTKIS
jgi:hypothetical protein